ncbi:MAG: tetratricopeptide repeat protein [Rickettsiales bacterium]|nr:tetratricopeptide repeat protein [Rickettsiales bacterium]
MIKTNSFKSFVFFVVIASLQSLATSAFASDLASNDDVIKQIEKTLLFDKDSRAKIDVYKKKKSAKKSDFTMTAGDVKDGEANSEIEILAVDPKSENFDIREKEKLAYNAALIGQYEVAVELYKQVIASESNNIYSKFSLAVVYQKLGQIRQAKTLYRDLLKDNPDNQEEIIGNLLAILIEESPKDAAYLLSRLTTQNPNSAYILAQAAVAYDKNKNYSKAIELLERAVEIDAANLGYKFNLAVIYDKTAQSDKAIDLYSQIEEKHSDADSAISIDQVQNRLQTLRNKL